MLTTHTRPGTYFNHRTFWAVVSFRTIQCSCWGRTGTNSDHNAGRRLPTKRTESDRSRHAAYWNEAWRRLQTREVFEHIALQSVTADECMMLPDLVNHTLLEQSGASIHTRSSRVDNNLQDYLGSAEEPLCVVP